jgi:thymidylate synthase (FAD)
VPALEENLYKIIPVLDKGFIRVIDYLGDDSAIVQAARVSYGAGTKKISDDRNLIRYLMRHRHSTPFEMCEIKLHVKMPIFVARQWIRHRTANVNEYSARYSILEKEFYTPDLKYLKMLLEERRAGRAQSDLFSGARLRVVPSEIAGQAQTNRQGRDDRLTAKEAEEAIKTIRDHSFRAYAKYIRLLNEETSRKKAAVDKEGIARELARMVLPTNYYTQWYWKIDLHNLLHFISLRADSHAQYEIRVYAEEVCKIVAKWVPITYEAFMDYRMGGAQLSAKMLTVIRRMIAGETVTPDASGLSKREWTELMAILEP